MTQENRPAASETKEFRTLLREMTTPYRMDNRRAHKRIPRSISLTVQPLDMDFQPDGEPFWALSRDISLRGLAFVNSEPVAHEFVRIGLLEYDATIIAKVRHSTPIGVDYPLFLVGVEFVGNHG